MLRCTNFGAFVELESGVEGLIHISQLADSPPEKVEDLVKAGDEVSAKVIKLSLADHKIGLSMKTTLDTNVGEEVLGEVETSEA